MSYQLMIKRFYIIAILFKNEKKNLISVYTQNRVLVIQRSILRIFHEGHKILGIDIVSLSLAYFKRVTSNDAILVENKNYYFSYCNISLENIDDFDIKRY